MADWLDTINQTPEDDLFYGRQAEMAWLADRLDRGERLLVIYGPARIGKSALLRQCVRRLRDDYLALYLDVGRAGGWGAESPLLQVAGEVGRSVRERTGMRVDPPEAASFADDPAQAWQAYLDLLGAQLERRRLVLLVDNVDRLLADSADPSSVGWLRALLEASSPAILAVQSLDRLAKVWPDPASVPPSIALGPLGNEAAESLVKALVSPKAQIDPWATRRVLEITSHQPYYIRLFCRALLECCAHRSPLTPPDVEEALTALLDMPLAEFSDAWQRLSPRQQWVLSSFGALRGTGGIATQYDLQTFCVQHGYPLPLKEIVAALDDMAQRGILEKLGANSYRFTVELFRLWVHRHRPPEYVLRAGMWRSGRSRMSSQLAKLGRALARRPRLWMSLGAIVLVALIVVLQPALRQGRTSPAATPTPTPAAATESAPLTRSAASMPLATDTPAPTPTRVLPAYDVAYMSCADEGAPWQIYVMNSETGERVRLTETGSNERTPKWSPDGRKLVFASDRDGNREVYVMDVASALQGASEADLVNLTRDEAPDWQPAWSPDGKRVAFSSYRDENWEIYLVDVDGTHLERLTEHPENDFSPTWSPDGQKLLFASRRYVDADLFVLDMGTRELAQLTKGELNEFDPAWSPNGEWIAYVTQIGDQGDIYVMRADGSEPVNLTHSAYANDFQPTWSPDSEWLIFASYTAAEGDHELFRMRRDGSEVSQLTDDEDDNLAPSWRPVAR